MDGLDSADQSTVKRRKKIGGPISGALFLHITWGLMSPDAVMPFLDNRKIESGQWEVESNSG